MTRGLLLLLALGLYGPAGAHAQELADRFRRVRMVYVAQEVARQQGMRLEPRPPDHLATRGDSLAAWMDSRKPEIELPAPEPPPPPFRVERVKVYTRLERPVFQGRHRQAKWAFMQGRRLTEIDTTSTADLRARLQAHFGPPTMTLAEMDSVAGRSAEEIIQFEYWMVVNDSIPVMIIDVNGPLSRGVVVATEARWRESLDALRYGLLGRLFTDPRREPFVDYFYQTETAAWYATGFDGATFFHQRIGTPNLTMGRPRLAQYVSDSQR
ncbi:MAG: hypothetical protein JJ896_18045 [Rhodothermales bacterium]|nr:hypothetical protein [Rhodothermales bacterium]MBO6781566.1 hypothetical protein [Rhodothermales bacterium]